MIHPQRWAEPFQQVAEPCSGQAPTRDAMVELVDSRDVAVSQRKALSPGMCPHVIASLGPDKIATPSSKIVGQFVCEGEREEANPQDAGE